MQEYLQRTRLGSHLDGFGFHILAFLIGMGWFILLWGLRLPALISGVALYVLIVLLRKKIRDDHLTRKEKQFRAVIGGELALERLLLSPPEKAQFETAMLLSLHWPLTLLRCDESGVLCDMKGKKCLISLVQLPPQSRIRPEQVLAFQREMLRLKADKGLICSPCPIAPEAAQQARSLPAVSFLSKEKLISVLGAAHPATDEQLVALGRRRRMKKPVKWLWIILDPSRARRYACYGALLLIMYQFTRLYYHAVPGLICVFLAAACRCVKPKDPLFKDEPAANG